MRSNGCKGSFSDRDEMLSGRGMQRGCYIIERRKVAGFKSAKSGRAVVVDQPVGVPAKRVWPPRESLGKRVRGRAPGAIGRGSARYPQLLDGSPAVLMQEDEARTVAQESGVSDGIVGIEQELGRAEIFEIARGRMPEPWIILHILLVGLKEIIAKRRSPEDHVFAFI